MGPYFETDSVGMSLQKYNLLGVCLYNLSWGSTIKTLHHHIWLQSGLKTCSYFQSWSSYYDLVTAF